MVFKPPIAVFDACVLYPFHLRNVLVQLAVDRLVDARWTDKIHDEWIRNLLANAPNIPVERLSVTRRLMDEALPSAMVDGYETHVETIELPDPDDRHVVAAGVAAGASLIVTWNLRDFPAEELRKHGLTSQTPDVLITDLFERVPEATVGALANARRNLSQTRISAAEFAEILMRQGLIQLSARLGRNLADL